MLVVKVMQQISSKPTRKRTVNIGHYKAIIGVRLLSVMLVFRYRNTLTPFTRSKVLDCDPDRNPDREYDVACKHLITIP